MRHFARLIALAAITTFVVGCWSEPIQIRTTEDNEQIPFASRSKARKALMTELGQAPAAAEKPAADAAEKPAAEKH